MTAGGLHETEEGFQMWVTDLAGYTGWRRYHTRFSQGSDPGWPDLVLARPPRLVIAELKAEGGRLSIDQRAWFDTLRACDTIETYMWRPADRPDIRALLAR